MKKEELHSYMRLDGKPPERLSKVIRICPECGREDVFYRYQRTKRCHRCRAKSKTDLGKRLYALRTTAVVSGIRLLSEEEVLDEVKRRRGELEEDEKDLY